MPPKKASKTQINNSLFREAPRHNTSLVPDVDAGRIISIPRTLVGDNLPRDTYVSTPFYFGGSNVRAYYKVDN